MQSTDDGSSTLRDVRSAGSGDGNINPTYHFDLMDPLIPYIMNYPKRGVALIFNHKKFEEKLGQKPRRGTQEDKDALSTVLKFLGFQVYEYDDLTREEIMAVLKRIAEMDHGDNDCFACCMLSHGDSGMLYSKDAKYKTDDLWTPFLGNKCASLAGKPKLFFIQACQGKKEDDGVTIRKTSFDSNASYIIPIYSDFLIGFSTVQGYRSWRNPANGSWYIQSLCAVLREFADKEDLLSIMTIVNHKVALEYMSQHSDPLSDQKKQMPYIYSTLTRKLYLKPKHPLQ